jgi:enoyl-CoA hydratase/carnithine racemase
VAFETITYSVEARIASISLNRPRVLNAISTQMSHELSLALEMADLDPEVKVVVLRGNGRVFSAGADLKERVAKAASDPEMQIAAFRREFAYVKIWDVSKVVIAMVHGQCIAGACQMVGMCDLTFASEDASFWEPEIRFVNPILVPITIYLMGLKNAKEFYLSGEAINAREAHRLGLVNRVIKNEELEAVTYEFAKKLAGYPASGLSMIKRSVNRVYEAMGLKLMTDVDIDFLSYVMALQEQAGGDADFRSVAVEKGLKAALAGRDRPTEE